nr:retrovirus-related Pol polyprotein from transposon TNT 1-94 [Tanacetum cinerariifolium]
MTKNIPKKLRRQEWKKCFRCGDPNHLIEECTKPSRDKNKKAFVGGSWNDSGEKDDEKATDETCLMAHTSSEICLGIDLEPDECIKDRECSKNMTGNRNLFLTYRAYDRGNVVFGGNLRESLNVTFNETPLPSKTSPLVDGDLDEEEAIKVIEKKNVENDIEDETIEVDEIVNIKMFSNIVVSKKQTALAISTTESEYIRSGKTCQQALWIKQALIDYDIRLDDVSIMCNNKGATDLSKNQYNTRGQNTSKFATISFGKMSKKEIFPSKRSHLEITSPTFSLNLLNANRSIFFTQKDYGTKRGRPSTSVSSLSSFDHPSSSHHIDDDNDEGKGYCVLVPTFCLLRFDFAFCLIEDTFHFAKERLCPIQNFITFCLKSRLRFDSSQVAF